MVIEQRRYTRTPIDAPLVFFVKGQPARRQGVAKDIALGGMFVETDAPAPFNAEIVVHLQLPGAEEVRAMPGIVRWVSANGMGVQFGLLGAVETHLITEINRKHAGSR